MKKQTIVREEKVRMEWPEIMTAIAQWALFIAIVWFLFHWPWPYTPEIYR